VQAKTLRVWNRVAGTFQFVCSGSVFEDDDGVVHWVLEGDQFETLETILKLYREARDADESEHLEEGTTIRDRA
jgi:hypothetical protein